MASAVIGPLTRHGFDEPIPSSLAVGLGAILLVRGWIAVAATAPNPMFTVLIDDEEQRFPTRGAELRFDVVDDDGVPPRGFFLPVSIEGRRAGTTVRLRVLADGWVLADQPLTLEPVARRTIDIDTPIAICLATFNPEPTQLKRQLDSIRAQTRRDWTCIVYDDGSRLERWAAIEELTRDDPRFRVFRSERNRGFYRNFEAALALVPSTVPYVGLSDQDDVWYPEKLAACIECLDANPQAQLVYTDMRVVDGEGRELAPSYWTRRRNNFQHLDTLLVANTVSGAASLFRGSLLDVALPFPPERGPTFHDHWLACAAFVTGGLEYVARPLYDYTQHADNVLGYAGFESLGVGGALARHGVNVAEMLLKPSQAWKNVWTMLGFYYVGYRRLHLIAETLLRRVPSLRADDAAVIALFDDRGRRAFELMLARHSAILHRGDASDMVEFKMGLGLLLHRALSRWLARVVSRSRYLRRSSARIVFEQGRVVAGGAYRPARRR